MFASAFDKRSAEERFTATSCGARRSVEIHVARAPGAHYSTTHLRSIERSPRSQRIPRAPFPPWRRAAAAGPSPRHPARRE